MSSSSSSIRSSNFPYLLSSVSTVSRAEKFSLLPIPSNFDNFNNSDLINKSARSKQKFLFQLPARLDVFSSKNLTAAPAAISLSQNSNDGAGEISIPASTLGRIGELSDLDTKNPILYIEFPSLGRLKLRGSIIYPHVSLVAVQFPRGKRSNPLLACKGNFDHIVAFSEYWWIGTKEENPEEKSLEWPKEFLNSENFESKKEKNSTKIDENNEWLGFSQERFGQDEDNEIEGDDGGDFSSSVEEI